MVKYIENVFENFHYKFEVLYLMMMMMMMKMMMEITVHNAVCIAPDSVHLLSTTCLKGKCTIMMF